MIYDLVIIDLVQFRIKTWGWTLLEPWSIHMHELNTNNIQQKIFNEFFLAKIFSPLLVLIKMAFCFESINMLLLKDSITSIWLHLFTFTGPSVRNMCDCDITIARRACGIEFVTVISCCSIVTINHLSFERELSGK